MIVEQFQGNYLNNRGALIGCRSLRFPASGKKKRKKETEKDKSARHTVKVRVETNIPNVWNKWCYYR